MILAFLKGMSTVLKNLIAEREQYRANISKKSISWFKPLLLIIALYLFRELNNAHWDIFSFVGF